MRAEKPSRGVSPVIAVVLLIGLTVASIGMIMVILSTVAPSGPPLNVQPIVDTVFSPGKDTEGTVWENMSTFKFKHMGGEDEIRAEDINFFVSGTIKHNVTGEERWVNYRVDGLSLSGRFATASSPAGKWGDNVWASMWPTTVRSGEIFYVVIDFGRAGANAKFIAVDRISIVHRPSNTTILLEQNPPLVSLPPSPPPPPPPLPGLVKLWENSYDTPGENDFALGVATDSQNNVIVVGGVGYWWNSDNIQVWKYDPNGNLLWRRTYGVSENQFNSPAGTTCDGTYLYITDTGNCRIVKRVKSNLLYVAHIGASGSADDRFSSPQGITSDGTYLYITDTGNHRIVKRLKSDLSYVAKIGSQGSGNDQFNGPQGITSDNTYLYITDMYNYRIVKRLKSDLSYVSKIGSYGSGDDQFDTPQGITCDNTYLYITDTYNHRIVKRLKSDLSYVAKIGSGGSGNDQFIFPAGITCDDNYLYITDTGNHRIVKRLKSDLSYVSKIGTQGSGNNQFDSPAGITCDGTYLYITDTGNHRIVKRLKSDLSYVSKIGTQGSGGYANDVAVDSNNNIIVVGCDGVNLWILKYNSAGTLLWENRIVPRSSWKIQTVDSTGNVGQYTSIANKGTINSHISYYDATNGDLKHAEQTGGSGNSWSTETVDSTGNVGQYTSMVLDGSYNPHISYYDVTNGNLKYAKWTGSSWSIENVDTVGNVGQYTSMVLVSDHIYGSPVVDYPVISYYDVTNGNLKCAKWTGSSWSIENVDTGGNVGRYTSTTAIPTVGGDLPLISYYDVTNGNLKYAKWTGSSWSIENVDTAGNVGQYTSIGLDGSFNPRISYYDVTNGNLKCAKWTGSSWSIENVDTGGNVGQYSSIGRLREGLNPCISYYDNTNGDLKYARWDGSSWSITAVDSTGNVGQYISAVPDSEPFTYISYYDATNGDLKYAEYIETVSIESGGVAVDSNNNFVVVGTTYPASYGMLSTVLTVKYDQNCNLLWERTYENRTINGPSGDDVAIDQNGNIFVSGRIPRPDIWVATSGHLLLKYDSNGTLLWDRSYAIYVFNKAFGVAVDSSGDVVTSGYTSKPPFTPEVRCFTIKWNQDGNIIWTREWYENESFSCGVAVDLLGNYATAVQKWTQYGEWDMAIVGYRPDSELSYLEQYDSGVDDHIEGITVDRGGNIIIVGYSGIYDLGDSRTIVVKYAAPS